MAKKHITVSYTVKSKKITKEWNGTDFIMLSDFHDNSYGVNVAGVLEDIDKIKPEFIVVAGDIYTGKKGLDNKNAAAFMKELSQRYDIYFSLGNHEQRMDDKRHIYGDMFDRFMEDMENFNIRLLQNEYIDIKKQDSTIRITGLRLDDYFYKKYKREPMEEGYLDKKLGKADKNIYNILLAHTPVYFKEYAAWGADLIFSGHLHGGMAKIPYIGGVIAPNYRLFPKYDSGKFDEYGSTMILGAGIGTHTINIRPFNPAEIVKVTLESE